MLRATHLLDVLSAAAEPATVAQLAAATGMAKTTVHRLLVTLTHAGVTTYGRNRYQLSAHVLRWARGYLDQQNLTQVARPHLVELRNLTQETTHLFVRQGNLRVCIDKVDSPHPLRRVMEVGTSAPLHAGSAGKVLLAWLPEDERNAILHGDLPSLTQNTKRDRDALDEEFEVIRARGHAVSFAERQDGLASVSAPIFGFEREAVAAIGVAGPLSRFTVEHLAAWAPAVQEAAGRITRQLGGRKPWRGGDAGAGAAGRDSRS